MRFLVTSVARMPFLNSLYLAANNITESGVKDLAEALAGMVIVLATMENAIQEFDDVGEMNGSHGSMD